MPQLAFLSFLVHRPSSFPLLLVVLSSRFDLTLPASFLSITEIWPSKEKMATLPADLPILLLSGLKDEIVPAAHMQEVRCAYLISSFLLPFLSRL